jgi:DNA-binding CsgD family transcriptional regulator
MARGGSSAAAAREATNAAAQTAPRGVWVDSGSRRFRSRCSRLSGKERLVLAELARGNTTEEIGGILHVSPHTVRTHIKNAMRKLEAKTRAHAVAIAMSEDAIQLEPPPAD